MKRVAKSLVLALVLTLMLSVNCQAAVKKVTITKPTKKSTYTVYYKNKNIKKQLKVTVTAGKKDNKAVTYKTSNKKVVAVTKKGALTIKKAGTATITVTSKKNKKAKDTLKIVVKQAPTKVAVQTDLGYAVPNKFVISKGNSLTLKSIITPSNAVKTITWKSSKKAVATVSKKGVVKGVKAGKTVITATAKGGAKFKTTLTVVSGKNTKLTTSKSSVTLVKGKTATVKAKLTTKGNGANSTLLWKSSNTKVATVTQAGKIKAVKKGSAKVYVYTVDGSKLSATVKVKVTNAPAETTTPEPQTETTTQPETETTTQQEETTAKFTVTVDTEKVAKDGGITVADTNTIKWDDSQKAIDAMNALTADTSKVVKDNGIASNFEAQLAGTSVDINGKTYVAKFVDSKWTFVDESGKAVDIAATLKDKTAQNVKIAKNATKDQLDTNLKRIFLGHKKLDKDYDFGTGTIVSGTKTYKVTKCVVEGKNHVLKLTVDDTELVVDIEADGSFTVTSTKSLNEYKTLVSTLFGSAVKVN